MNQDDSQNKDDGGEAGESGPAGTDAAPEWDPLAQAALEAENANLKDRLLRAVAEMENLRKRTAREITETRAYAISGFARDMLSAADNLERALNSVPDGARDNADATLGALIEGMEMTDREMGRLMAKHGVAPIVAMGEKFDPHKHQAMFEVPDPEAVAGTVVQVVQTGFAIGDRILRPAMVGVARGGPMPAQAAAAESEEEAPEHVQDADAPSGSVDKSV